MTSQANFRAQGRVRRPGPACVQQPGGAGRRHPAPIAAHYPALRPHTLTRTPRTLLSCTGGPGDTGPRPLTARVQHWRKLQSYFVCIIQLSIILHQTSSFFPFSLFLLSFKFISCCLKYLCSVFSFPIFAPRILSI